MLDSGAKKIYCRKCGSKLVETECNYYDEYTGEKVHQMTCPNKKCECYCDFWGHDYKNRHWWCYETECKKCGYIPQDY